MSITPRYRIPAPVLGADKRAWPERPRGLSERSYRKYMAKTKTVRINGTEFQLQSVSPTWYLDHNDKTGMTGSKKKTAAYMDGLFKNVVIAPKEVQNEGIGYFDAADDLSTAEELLKEIESFLRERSGS